MNMNNNYLNKPIVLIGMMGAGKSYIGSALAKHFDVEFSDSDKIVEQRAGCSVSEIFERFGEEKFREAEKNAILNLLDKPPHVIATGGGAVTTLSTLEAIKKQAVSVWLNVELEILLERVSGRKTRPLLKNVDVEKKLSKLLHERIGLYRQADIQLDINHDNKHSTLSSLINLLSENLN